MKGYNARFLLDDICLCASKECPKYDKCLRGNGYKKAKGIYTVSLLSEICNTLNNYEMFIRMENNND